MNVLVSFDKADVTAIYGIFNHLVNNRNNIVNLCEIDLKSNLWRKKVFDLTNVCDVLVIVYNKTSEYQEFVDKQINFAKSKKKKVIVYSVDGSTLSNAMSFQFRTIPVIDGRIDYSLDKLTKWLRETIPTSSNQIHINTPYNTAKENPANLLVLFSIASFKKCIATLCDSYLGLLCILAALYGVVFVLLDFSQYGSSFFHQGALYLGSIGFVAIIIVSIYASFQDYDFYVPNFLVGPSFLIEAILFLALLSQHIKGVWIVDHVLLLFGVE